ncbi:sodium/hydrogen exchanger 6 [Tanacetum coccineum]|uniref:Sodium/hydrogen exchanger 6 n=1 Tax=Tanacetum coccineum TaxID=301880 RepID=A0ABQ5AIY1_9ASTR
MVSDAFNTLYDGNQVPGAFVNHYNQFLRAEGINIPLDDHELFTRVLDDAKADFMVRDISNDEVKSVIFSMGDDRAPGPDGFTADFFKKAWDMVGGDITCAVRDFFSNGKLLKELNHTIISFIPKIIANRVKEGLGDIVSINQSAFVPGRRIYDNILLTQKLIRNYHRRCSPRPMILWIGAFLRLFLGVRELRVRDSDDFQYHHLCEQQRIINLCFADDLFLFSRGNPSSVAVIMAALEEFKQVSGLVPSIPKSTTFFCNVPNAIKESILNSMPFAEGVLPVRNKFLSLASRLQLIRSVLSSMHIYLPSVFILPNRIVHDLEQLMHGFLWCQGEIKKGKAKVVWDSVCVPKHEGGLGIRRIDDFNVSLMATYIWSDVSWGWHKLLQIRSIIQPFIWHKINNGKSTSVWFGRWADLCPLKDMFSNKDIARSGFSLDDPVPLLLDDIDDVILWRDRDVRFPHCIPRHATHMWLVFQQKLKTQDRLRQWDVSPSIDLNLLRCSLCHLVPDSHDHLFFECAYSSHVWSKVRVLCGMDSILPWLIDVTTFINHISKGKTAVSILSRLVLATTSYYIWMEMNGRLFKKKTSSPNHIVDVIISMVRLKLVTFKFKKMSTRSRMLLD